MALDLASAFRRLEYENECRNREKRDVAKLTNLAILTALAGEPLKFDDDENEDGNAENTDGAEVW